MSPALHDQPAIWPALAWVTVAVAAIVAPAAAMLLLPGAGSHAQTAPILAVGLMGAGMIGAAVAGRFGSGIMLALVTGLALLSFAWALGALGVTRIFGLPGPVPIGLAMVAAAISFAARGALFARSGGSKGWWIAVFVVGGEAAILATAAARPGVLPDWLLVLLPAQWASIAIRSALSGSGMLAAGAPLIALLGTAAATMLVERLWPNRWPYLVMFTTWLGFSALVYHHPV